MESSNVIAWLLPSSTNQPALEAIRMPQNATRTVSTIPSSYEPIIQTPNPNQLPPTTPTIDPSLLTKSSFSSLEASLTKPRPALSLTFTSPPKSNPGFVLGTDPALADILLPSLPGIAPAHCHITFDASHRLVLVDTSHTGTAVWYDGASSGDRTRESWVLGAGSSYGFPSMVDRVVIDIQTVRFQVIINEAHVLRPEVYKENVETFMSSLESAGIIAEAAAAAATPEEKTPDLDASILASILANHSYSYSQKEDQQLVRRDEKDVCDFYYNFNFDLGFDLSYDCDYDFDYDMSDDEMVDDVAEEEKMDFLPPIPSVVPPAYVKYLLTSDDGAPPETYLWNTAKPWEPMVKVVC
ncbi:hypothetical protein CABS01_12028 [Colletotrichum abscissum]|uniref:FHA domain-containing protein n=1 Tax=Colletotrichum abscissum TaxID=1671311 RepID=A0A9Q0B4Z9_9PEZI|nr:uncharacterized protein CABS01_12028 [Colletotrichum abscissum]KAI3553443.1 hypothetical protein CABS02_06315 [Colletotrichum abscissum]KAK1491704.1 hypothetical protein CABS01_12028 [Colletotrichum abscissum]